MAVALSAIGVQSVPLIVNNYWEESIQQSCGGTNFCAFDFSRVPTAKTLIVTNVSCGFTVTIASSGFASVILDKRNAAGDIIDLPRIDLFPGKKGEVANTVQFWAVANQVSHIVGALLSPRIEATVLGAFSFASPQSCTVVGILTP